MLLHHGGSSSSSSKGKGLSVAKGGVVCLLQHYCPFCFKGKPGVSSGLKVKKGSQFIDEVQAMHAAKGNGLCPIDFRHPGEFCSNPLLCKLVCLVCGKAMVDGEDPEFELFLDAFGGYSTDEEIDVATNHEMKMAVKSLGLVWTNQWSTPIHKACSKKAACKCVVALGTAYCPKCEWPAASSKEVAPLRAKSKAGQEEQTKAAVTATATRVLVDPRPVAAPVAATIIHTKVVTAHTTGAIRMPLAKADWLPPPSMTAHAVYFSAPDLSINGKHSKDPSDHTKGKSGGGAKLQAVKTVKTIRLEQAASTCAYKIDAWTAVHPTNKKLGGGPDWPAMGGLNPKENSGRKFSLTDHYRLFDPAIHGWMKIKGMKGFMHYNGVFVPTEHDVICIHEDGTITPG